MKCFREFWVIGDDDADGRRCYRGVDELTSRWPQVAPGAPPLRYGRVLLPYGSAECDQFLRLFDDIAERLPIRLNRDHVCLVADQNDILDLEFVELFPMAVHEMTRSSFEAAFVRDDCDPIGPLQQRGHLRASFERPPTDFAQITYRDMTVGIVVSRLVREILEARGANAAFQCVEDERSGKLSAEQFQLIPRNRVAVHPRTRLYEAGFHIHGTPLSGLGFELGDPRYRELYFAAEAYRYLPLFATEHMLGARYWLNEARRQIVVSGDVYREMLRRNHAEGFQMVPAFVRPNDAPPVWPGTYHLGRDAYLNRGYLPWFHEKTRVLAELFGQSNSQFVSARVPLHLGGESSVMAFPGCQSGVAYVTTDMIGWRDQRRNAVGSYELMACARQSDDEVAWLIARLAKLSAEKALGPGDVIDISAVVPRDSTLSGILLCEPELKRNRFRVHEEESMLLLCVGITGLEVAYHEREGHEALVQHLKEAAVFASTDLYRRSIV